jgi:4-aminobutyrate aminotransferase-like enzyme/Ser/Thr protein kinase RdoA (MazF antagonist)
MLARPPVFTTDDAVEIAQHTFGVAADAAADLGSERDQTFRLLRDGNPVAIMKVSNAAEDVDRLDMEAAAVAHIARVDAGLRVPQPWPVGSGASHRAAYGDHWVRMYDVLPGRARCRALDLSDRALGHWGAMTARLGRAMRGFVHPKAIRHLPWDVQHAAATRPMIDAIAVSAWQSSVRKVLDRYDDVVAPAWPSLRHQVVHGDLTTDNALVADDGTISGIVDFGDMTHSALMIDIAASLDSLCSGRSGEEMLRSARLVVDGYQRVMPFEEAELRLIGEVWATRSAVGVAIAAWRAEQGLEDREFAERYSAAAVAMIDALLDAGWDQVARWFGARLATAPTGAVAQRRYDAFGPAMEPLTYDEPIHLGHGDGAWIIAADGRRYLDAYNNVACVGHAHPRVATAVARAARRINTNMRYLDDPTVELAERLIELCPPHLDTVMFVNSGSEANDLAWRAATVFTGGDGALCTHHAYHGITHALTPLSPEIHDDSLLPSWVDRWRPADTYRNLYRGTDEFDAALLRLGSRGHRLAATVLDGVLQSDGVYDLDPGDVQAMVQRTHDAGGLWIADEVQGGHGRTGESMWSFQRFGIEPDFVTLGKPMGNGIPVGAVITRRDIAERFAEVTTFFSTFAGGQVATAASLAVLDVLRDEDVLTRVTRVGTALRRALDDVAAQHEVIGDVRSIGLAIGIEIVTGGSTMPNPALAATIKNAMRHHGVLVGATGEHGNVLKVRPPLAFADEHIGLLIDALTRSLSSA